MAIAPGLKQLAEKSKWSLVLYTIAATYRTRIRFGLGKIDSFSGSSHATLSAQQSLDYINQVFDDFILYGNLSDEWIRGKRFLELGPGDNVGVGLRFLAKGAQQYFCLDKFYSNHDIENERQIYLKLREFLPESERINMDRAVKLEGKLELNPDKIRYTYGSGAQHADRALPNEKFDCILSRGVLQEIYEIDRAFEAMDKLIADNGILLHKIDLRDYGLFSGVGYHPREFLTIPEAVYHMMAYDSDKPNRRMLNYYKAKMTELAYEAEFWISGVIEPAGYKGIQKEIVPHKKSLEKNVDYDSRHMQLIDEVRPLLASQFKTLTDEELLAGAVFLVARKKPRSSGK